MLNLGDFELGQVVRVPWNTAGANGASITRATDGNIYVYKDFDTATEVQTGVADVEDHDTDVGTHACTITLSDSFYAAGHDYQVKLKAATIDGQTVNAWLAVFSIRNRAGSRSTVRGVATSGGDINTVPTASLYPAASQTNQFKGRVLVFDADTTTAALRGQITEITASTSGGVLTVKDLTDAPASGDAFCIY